MATCYKPWLGALSVGLACVVAGVLMVVLVPGIIEEQVVKNVRLEPNGMAFNMWKDIPIPFFFSIHLFEVVNPKEVLSGAKPVVNQRGPYVYREHRQKTNITFHDNGTISFVEYRRFFFEPSMTNGTEDDYIVIPNILVLGAAVMLEDLPFPLKLTVSGTFVAFGQTAFLNRTVRELLWGYDEPLLDFLNSIKPGMLPFKGKFGLFVALNDTDSGLFTVHSGMDDIAKVHMVDTWNGLRKLSYWNSDECNMINGTSGQMWPPFMTPSTPLTFYSPDACRSMELEYRDSGHFKGIPTLTFVAPKTLFANGADYPPNEGFCPCRQSGIQNLSSCQHNAPMFLSQPHFLNGDPELLKTVDGLHPNEEAHGIFLNMHAMTGIPVKCVVRMQMNLYIKKVIGILQTKSIKPVVLPVLWFAESGKIEGDLLTEFYTNLVLIPSVLGYLQYCLIALGGLLLITAVMLLLRKSKTSFLQQKGGPVALRSPPSTKYSNRGQYQDYQGPQGKLFLFWSSNKGSDPKEASQASKEKTVTSTTRKEVRM
ncbi:scavenger receptor class B member 1 isoform X2 [Hemicordylus capensis]|uniref:scavenger receptor class B member 1 isoform X2 n=1 Tax=Hemicordylus capensis TaxID=884348 RepID=UPI00230205E0|nr:scavenger receptor class B member 1 isoform X2 [Hemicordylus capensis]